MHHRCIIVMHGIAHEIQLVKRARACGRSTLRYGQWSKMRRLFPGSGRSAFHEAVQRQVRIFRGYL